MGTLIPLGTAGWMPVFGNQTMSLAVKQQKRLLLIDLGTGVSRLASPEVRGLVEPYEDVTVLLSHFHLDHLVGISYLPHLFCDRDVHIYGPGMLLWETETQRVLENLVSDPYYSLPLNRFPMDLRVGELRQGWQQLNGWWVKATRLVHPGGSLAFCLDDGLCYVSDGESGMDLVGFARGASLLCHEVWWQAGTDDPAPGHAEVSAVARLALEAGVGQLALMHFNPAHDRAQRQQLLISARKVFSRTLLLEELGPITY